MPKGDRLRLKADPEDGTTPIANLLLDAVAIAKLSGLHKGAILHLWRVTYGWTDDDGRRRKEAKISLSEWAKALDTDNTRSSKTLAELVGKNIVSRRVTDAWGGYYYRLNTDIASWNSGSINHTKLREIIGIPDFSSIGENATVGESTTIAELPTVDQNDNATVGENATQQLAKTQLPTLYKEIVNKDKERSDALVITNSEVVMSKRLETTTKEVKVAKKMSRYPIELAPLRKQVIAGLKSRRTYASPQPVAEADAISKMLVAGYTPDEILGVWTEMKSEPFWSKQELSMMSLHKQIGAKLQAKQNGVNNGAHQSNGQASGQSTGDSPENSKYISGKYGHLVQH